MYFRIFQYWKINVCWSQITLQFNEPNNCSVGIRLQMPIKKACFYEIKNSKNEHPVWLISTLIYKLISNLALKWEKYMRDEAKFWKKKNGNCKRHYKMNGKVQQQPLKLRWALELDIITYASLTESYCSVKHKCSNWQLSKQCILQFFL
jgi:hypothetical protein